MTETNKLLLYNVLVAVFYWGISHLNWMVFSSVGVLPMPIWPAAAVALVAALYWGWGVAPGIAIGAFLANYYSLGASFLFAACISVMNTVGPVVGASLIRMRITDKLKVRSIRDIGYVLMVGVCFVPLLTALGGIGSKFILGMLPADKIAISVARWSMAHALGTLLFALPYLAWVGGRKKDG